MKLTWPRPGAWFFVGTPEFNPSYVYLGIGVLVLCAAVLISFLLNLGGPTQIASISSLTVTINILAMCAVNQNKAAIIANATSSGEIARGLTNLRPFGGKATDGDVDELVKV